MKFDSVGRLLVTDNDPDSRGPNRLLHVIEGGRYGYKSRFGVSGLHPYDSWNGELPGTLPMIAGVGEAPVGLLDCAAARLPTDYQGNVLVCVWGTNQVVRVKTKHRGVSLAGFAEPLVVGDRSFRPTGIVATSDGTIYISDWADRRYPVHGKGRVWRLRPTPELNEQATAFQGPATPFSLSETSESQRQIARVEELRGAKDFSDLVRLAANEDPFLSVTALRSLGGQTYRRELETLLESEDADRRLIALLALRMAGVDLGGQELMRLIRDRDSRIRRMGLVWAGETMRFELAEPVESSFQEQVTSPELFETYLATVQLLSEEEAERCRNGTPGARVDREFDTKLLRPLLDSSEVGPSVRAMALRYFESVDDPKWTDRLSELALAHHGQVASEAVRAMAQSKTHLFVATLQSIAEDPAKPISLRCDALASLANMDSIDVSVFAKCLQDSSEDVATTATRAMRGRVSEPKARQALQQALARLARSSQNAPRVIDAIQSVLEPEMEERPASDREWIDALTEGNVSAGRRVFFDSRTLCSKCHRMNGRGGRVGPDLSRIATAKTREQIIRSILHPSEERSPDYQGYKVLMVDGTVYQGTQFHYRGESADLRTTDGKWVRFKLEDAEDYRPLEVSLMPDDLHQLMSVEEFRDLIAYLCAPTN